jgi:predicted nuclease with TOPRIM domain
MLQEREDRIAELSEEVDYSKQAVSRVEDNMRTRDAEAAEYMARLRKSDSDAEALRDELAAVRRENARTLEQRERALADAQSQAADAQAQMQAALQTQAQGAVHGATLEERTSTLETELERARRQVHELQQASADKDLRIMQLGKQRLQDKEDVEGLNIALDSKQQELELVSTTCLLGLPDELTPLPAQAQACYS